MVIHVDFLLLQLRKMDNSKSNPKVIISLDQIEKIERSSLSILEKHHLRLMLHCLESFRQMLNTSDPEKLPDQHSIRIWLLNQPGLEKEEIFVSNLLHQFALAANQLEELADRIGISPFGITVEDLISEHLRMRDAGTLHWSS